MLVALNPTTLDWRNCTNLSQHLPKQGKNRENIYAVR